MLKTGQLFFLVVWWESPLLGPFYLVMLDHLLAQHHETSLRRHHVQSWWFWHINAQTNACMNMITGTETHAHVLTTRHLHASTHTCTPCEKKKWNQTKFTLHFLFCHCFKTYQCHKLYFRSKIKKVLKKPLWIWRAWNANSKHLIMTMYSWFFSCVILCTVTWRDVWMTVLLWMC